ncbi:hypothetical protein ES703_97658 [subsurface metagenome]
MVAKGLTTDIIALFPLNRFTVSSNCLNRNGRSGSGGTYLARSSLDLIAGSRTMGMVRDTPEYFMMAPHWSRTRPLASSSTSKWSVFNS